MEQEIKDKTSLRITISDILSIQKNNQKVNAMNVNKKQELTDKFKKTKVEYARIINNKEIPYVLKQKRNLEYVFTFEQYNLKVLPLENNIKKNNLYESRLDYVLKYLNAKNGKSISQTKALEYAINNALMSEAITYYDSAIEEARQYRIVYSKFKFYVDYLDKIHDSDYEKYAEVLPSQEEVEIYDDRIDRLQREKAQLIDILRTEKFTMNNMKLPDLTSNDVKHIMCLMYPSFKEILSNDKKGKQVA